MRSIKVALLALVMLAGCGSGDKGTTVSRPADLLQPTLGSTGITRVGDVRTFVGQDLWEYIDGGAELYHTYNFIEVATGDYKKDKTDIVADIYLFDTPLNAYGLYSMLRPEEPDFIKLGAEGYIAPAAIMFVADRFLVKLTAFEDTDETSLTLVNLADDLEEEIGGAFGPFQKPSEFDLFPSDVRIQGTDQYWSGEFAGHEFMTAVYSIDYQLDSTRITLFLSDAEPGKKVLDWSASAQESGKLEEVPAGLAFDDGKGFATVDGYYGTIVLGMKNGHLAGVLGYDAGIQSFVAGWLKALGTVEGN